MKKMCSWALVRYLFMIISVVVVGFGSSVVAAADAQELPTSAVRGYFHPWKIMHPSTFTVKMDAVWEQCNRTEPRESWLTPKHCSLLIEMIEGKQCKVVMVPDGIRLDRLLGRVNGGTGASQPWARQEKQTGRLDRALLCDLGDGVHSYWFTGDKGKSCNNVAFVHLPPPLAVAPVPPPVVKKPERVLVPLPTPVPPPPPAGKWVCVQVPVSEALQSPVGHHHEGFVLRNDCCCDNDLVVRSHTFYVGSTVQSAGYTEQCYFQP
jgi:hypothetical protein